MTMLNIQRATTFRLARQQETAALLGNQNPWDLNLAPLRAVANLLEWNADAPMVLEQLQNHIAEIEEARTHAPTESETLYWDVYLMTLQKFMDED